MYEDCYLCECNIEWAEKLKDHLWRTAFVDTELRSQKWILGMRLARYNGVILYNSVMMLTHGDCNYAE